jgi:hypothetical protein
MPPHQHRTASEAPVIHGNVLELIEGRTRDTRGARELGLSQPFRSTEAPDFMTQLGCRRVQSYGLITKAVCILRAS